MQSNNSYDKISRINHWLTAIAVLTMLAIGLYFNDMPRGDEKFFWRGLHISIGATALLFIVFRIGWRLRQGMMPPIKQAAALQWVAKITHWLILLGIAVMFITGPLTVWTTGGGINVFDLFTIPSPMERMHDLHEWLEEVHAIAAKVLMALIGMHISAAILHIFKDPEQMNGRMWD